MKTCSVKLQTAKSIRSDLSQKAILLGAAGILSSLFVATTTLASGYFLPDTGGPLTGNDPIQFAHGPLQVASARQSEIVPYALKYVRTQNGSAVPQVYCEGFSSGDVQLLTNAVPSTKDLNWTVSVTFNQRQVRHSRWSSPDVVTGSDFIIEAQKSSESNSSASENESGTCSTIKGHLSNINLPGQNAVGGIYCSESNGVRAGAQNMAAPDQIEGAVQISKVNFQQNSTVRLRIVKPSDWKFDEKITARCANLIFDLEPVRAVQSAAAKK